MKRLIPVVILAAASIVLAQAPNQATLRTASGDRVISVTHLGAQTMFAADEVIGALGGAVSAEGNGFKAAINSKVAAFGPDSRFAVVGEDLIEMPVAPITLENRSFVPWQFFQGFLSKSNDLDVTWDATARVLSVKPAQHNAVAAQVSVANVQGVSKVVVTLSAPSEYTIVKEPQAYTIHFKSQVQAPFTDQTYEDPNVTKASFNGSDMRIDLSAADVQEAMNRATNVASRGVKQAPFKVLVGATMPAALVEVAFISNPDEEAKLKNDAFVNSVVGALTTAIEKYKGDFEARIGVKAAPSPALSIGAPAATPPKKAGQ
jgi:hypothetical protein